MTKRSDDRPQLEGADRALVERVAGAYAPRALSPAERVRFDGALAARIHEPRRRALLVPALAAAAAAGLMWIGVGGGLDPDGPEGGTAQESGAWEYELLLSSDVRRSDAGEQALPHDYEALASLFLDG